jgi:outer membrane protein
VKDYEDSLDAFKIDLGLPIELPIEIDPAELERVSQYEIKPLEINLANTVSEALGARLDVKNTRDRVEDASRTVEVAKNAFKPRLDVSASYAASTKPDTQALNFADGDHSYGAGLALELPLDMKGERNAFRRALIDLEASRRALNEKMDRTSLEVRDAFRGLEQAEQSYRIQERSLALAERRVESTTILQQAGRAVTRDVLDARNALVQAQNSLIQARIEYVTARLDLLLSTETLRIEDNRIWIPETETGSGVEVN